MTNSSDTFEVSFRGLQAKFRVSNPEDLIQLCHTHGYYFDVEELEDLLAYLPWDSHILDIGANVGNHTVFWAKQFSYGKVIPFEVNPPAYSLLKDNVELNDLKNVDLSYIGIGLSAAPGQIFLSHSRDNNLGGTAFNQNAGIAGQASFWCEKLDNLLPKIERVDFIKIDVEGMEFLVLEGAEDLIARTRPLIFLENFGWVSGLRLLNWIASHGYRIEKIYGPNYLLAPMPRGKVPYEASYVDDLRQLANEAIARGSASYAIESLSALLPRLDSDPTILHALAEAFLKLDSLTLADECLGKIDPKISSERIGILQSKYSLSEKLGDQNKVRRILAEAFEIAIHDANISSKLVESYWSVGEKEKAYDVASKYVARNEDSARGHHLKSVMAERLGKFAEAIEHAELATKEASPDTPSLMVRLADLMRAHGGDISRALDIVEKAILLGQTSEWAESVRDLIKQRFSQVEQTGRVVLGNPGNGHFRRKSGATVGIVVVSYNASVAVRVTLSSLRRARNDASFKLILIDNASDEAERNAIRMAMQKHIAEMGESWRYIEQDRNLGFSGGNNVGVAEFMADEEIAHICLLNSDVIVTDHWLDRLLASRCDIISAVTNKADSEQCVPVDYRAELGECLDERLEAIQDNVYRRISDFAERWHEAWGGNLVETDVTFFCVLLTKGACRDIGLLDETFFPGGFEDDDYCLRARNAGYHIHLARDVFIHHWGSASFGQLQYEYFSGRAQRNKEYLEKKHGIVWRRRPEKPIVSFAMDIDFALRHRDRFPLQAQFIELYLENLASQIDYFESEFRNLRNALAASDRAVPEILARQVAAAEAYGDLHELWDSVVRRTKGALTLGNNRSPETDSVTSDLERIAAGVHDRVECNFAIHAFITTPDQPNGAATLDMPPPATAVPAFASRPTTRLGKFFWIVRRGIGFILQFDGIVFFGGYFYPERQSDGYFQRIQIVDRLFTDRWRVYVESDELRGRNIWFDRPEPKVLVLRIIGTKKRRMLVRLLALLAVFRSRKIYFHSVLRMYDNRFGRLLHLPFIRKAVDIHGVVPEEFRMHNDFFSAVLYEKEEKLAVEKAGIVIVVTDAMRQYLQQKFRNALKAKTISFPMFPSFTPTLATRPLVDGKPLVVYAGGLHKWQQVPKMIDAIVRTVDRCSHRFYCPEPQVVKDMLPPMVADVVTVESKTHAELMTLYPQCHYGFILREDIIVNRVACPTKLVEYLAMGIVPIVDCEDIGDFKSLGMRFIHLDDFLAGRLPGEEQRVEMAVANFSVYERLKEVRQTGAGEIHAFFTSGNRAGRAPLSLMSVARRLLPPDTLAGRKARQIFRAVAPASGASASLTGADVAQSTVPLVDVTERLPACDILVQVDNFEAGGLENVVIDLNSTLSQAGFHVVLLVLGNQGPAVQRARDLGQTVICRLYAHDTHAALLEQLKPKLVLAHYSFRGVDLCRQKAIPFVQVIHNVYMWFSDQQRREFAEMAAMTTAFVAVSDYVRSYSVSRLGVAPAQCVVIPNGIDLEPFKSMNLRAARTSLRAQHGIAEEEFVFLDVGAINHQKNHLGMIKAFEIALQTCRQARLAILGPCYEAGLLQEMLAYVEKQGLQGKVLYCGSAPGVHEYFAMADAFVTATFFEGGPLTLLEAIAANLPVVMPAVGLARHFADCQGIELVDPVYDMAHYSGAIWEMKSTHEFEHRLAEALVRTWKNPVRPKFSETELATLGKGEAYEIYVRLITDIIGGKRVERVPEEGASALEVA